MARLAVVLSLLFAGVFASNVVDLNSDNFDSIVISGKPALVEFYAPWCGHCKNLAPIYEEVADAFANQKNKVIVAKIDADGVGREIGQKYGVTGFPTLKWFDGSDSEPTPYEGQRDFDTLTQFIAEKSGARVKSKPPPATVQVDANNFDEIVMDSSKHVLLAFTASWCGHCKALKPLYEKASVDFLPESNCVIANIEADAEKNTELSRSYGISSFPTIKFFGKDDKKSPIDYDGQRTEEAFVAYLNEKCGTHRAVGGGLNDKAGRVEKLDDLASQFFVGAADARKKIYDEAITVAESAGSYGQHYLKVMQKVVNSSDEYLAKETKRLNTILKKRTMSDSKLDEIKIRANILGSFAEKKLEEAEEAAESAAQKIKEEL